MGSEDTGIDEELLRHAHEQIKIPQKGDIESLNVSAAAPSFCMKPSDKEDKKKASRKGGMLFYRSYQEALLVNFKSFSILERTLIWKL